MHKRSNKRVLFLVLSPPLSSTSPREPQTAFRVRPLTPYPKAITPNATTPKAIRAPLLELDLNASTLKGMLFYPLIFSPSQCRTVDESESEAEHESATGDNAASERADVEGVEVIAGPGSVLDSTAGLDSLVVANEYESEAGNELETKIEQKLDSNYTQTSGSAGDPGDSPLRHQFPLLGAAAPLEAFDPAHQVCQYPCSSPRTTINGIFSAAKHAALEHYDKNTDTFTNPDGSQCPLVYPWMTELIIDKIDVAESRMLNEVKTIIRKPVNKNGGKGLFHSACTQLLLCGKMRRETIRAAEEAFTEIDQREGLFSPENGIVINSIANGKTPSSRPPFSFSYTGTHMTRSSSATFPCLCKEGFDNRVGSCVLARTMTALANPIMQRANDVSSSSPSEHRKMLHDDYSGTLSTILAEALFRALQDIPGTEDEDGCNTSCNWFDMVHVQPWMLEIVWQNAKKAVEDAEQFLRSDRLSY